MNLLKKVAAFIIAVVLIGVLGAGTYYVVDNIQSGSSLEETADNVKIEYQQGDSNRRVTQNLGLANSVNGVEVVWTSSDTSVISIQGNIGVVNDVEETKHVTLTATIKNGSKEKVKDFVVTVVKKHYNVVFDGFEQYNIKIPFNSIVTNVPTPTKEGFTFKHWSLETNGVSFDFSNKIVKDTTFYAVFDQNNTEATYKVEHYYENLTNNGYTLEVEKSEIGTISTLTSAVSIPRDGFIKINHPNSVEVGEIKADGSLVLRVYYQLVRKNVSFDLQGGSGNIPSQAIKVGSKVITPSNDPTKEGLTFKHWSLEVDGLAYDFNETVNNDLVLYAVYDTPTYNVSFYKDGELLNSQQIKKGNSAVAPINYEKEGYDFIEWDKDFSNVESNLEVNAIYKIRNYPITFVGLDNNLILKINADHFSSVTPPQAPSEVGYTFVKWSQETNNISGPMTVVAEYQKNTYTVRFFVDGNLVDTQEVLYLENATSPDSSVTVKESTAEFSYTFDGWSEDILSINKDLDVHAKFIETRNNYTYTFLSEDGLTKLKEVTVPYGTIIVKPDIDPTKESTPEFDYTFSGYSGFVNEMIITEDVTFRATFTSTTRRYQVVFVVEGLTAKVEEVLFGNDATPPVATKPQTDEEVFTFDSWSASYENIQSDITLTAIFTSSPREYVITFINYDDSLIEEINYAYGQIPMIDTPSREGEPGLTYDFVGWAPNITQVTGNQTYKAQYKENYSQYLVEFYQGETKLGETRVNYGETAYYPNSTIPTREMDEEFEYHFYGWSTSLEDITEDLIVQAIFSTTPREYIYEIVSNGRILAFGQVPYGETIPTEQIPATPDNKEGYHFVSWKSDDESFTFDQPITKRTLVEAVFRINEYTIKFVNYDGTLLEEATFEHGKMPVYNEATPIKEQDAQYSYTFNNTWSPQLSEAVMDQVYVAQFDKTPRSYTITFKDENGDVLSNNEFLYGSVPTHTPEPTKGSTDEFDYEFAGWDQEVVAVTGEATYIATYRSIRRSYKITFVDEDGSLLKEFDVLYGNTPTFGGEDPTKDATVSHTYTFAGWTPEIVAVAGEATYMATFTENIIAYTVTWIIDGEISTSNHDYNTPASHLDPEKLADLEYTYTFAGWSLEENGSILSELPNVTSNITIYAVFTKTANPYEITFDSQGGSDVSLINTTYGATIPTLVEPTKDGYTFSGWHLEGEAFTLTTMPARNILLVATWTINKYDLTLVFDNGDDNQIITQDYNSVIDEVADPTKEGYTFVGWDPLIPEKMPVDGLTVTAKWTINEYTLTIVFDNSDANQVITQDFDTPIAAIANPVKEGYEFIKWSEEIPTNMPAVNKTITAIWQINQYTIDFDSNGGTPVASITKDYNAEVVDPYPPSREGHTFSGWLLEGNLYTFSTMPATDLTLVAKWEVNNYSITYVLNDGVKSAATYLETADYNTTLTFTTEHHPTKEGFYFKGWTVHNITVDNSYNPIVEVKGDVILIANWLRVNKTIEDIVASGYSTIANELDNENVYLNKDTNNLTLDILVKKPSANVDTYLTNLEETLTNLYTNSGADTVSVTLPSVSEATTFKDLLQEKVIVEVNKTVTNFKTAQESKEIIVNFVRDYYEVIFEAGDAIDDESFDLQSMVTPALDSNNILGIEKASNTLDVTFDNLPDNYQIAKVEVNESGVIVETITSNSLTLNREITQDTTIKVYIELVSYRVRFEKDELYETQIVKHGKLATEPSYEIKDGYIQGWYEKVVKNEEENNDENDTVQPIEDVPKFDFTQPILKDTVIKYFENVTIEKAFENAQAPLQEENMPEGAWETTYEGSTKPEKYANIVVDSENQTITVDVLNKNILLVEVLEGSPDGFMNLFQILAYGTGKLAPGIETIMNAVKESGAKYFSIPIDPNNASFEMLLNFSELFDATKGRLNGQQLPIGDSTMQLNIVAAVFARTVANLTDSGYFDANGQGNPVAPNELQLMDLLGGTFESMFIGEYPIILYGQINGEKVETGSMVATFKQNPLDATATINTLPNISVVDLFNIVETQLIVNPLEQKVKERITKLGSLHGITKLDYRSKYIVEKDIPEGYTVTKFEVNGIPIDTNDEDKYEFVITERGEVNIFVEIAKSYEVKFYGENGIVLSEQTVEHGQIATAVAEPTKGGYSFAGWFKDQVLTEEFDINEAITSDLSLYPKFALNDITNGELQGLDNKVYSEEKLILTASFEHHFKDDVTFRWYKDDVLVADANSNTLEIQNVNDSGTYKVVITITNEGQTVSLELSKAVTIIKATYNMGGITFEGAKYTYDGTAKSLEITDTLPNGVTVSSYVGNGQTNVGTYIVTAKFIGDADNYNPIEDKTATLQIEKALATITVHNQESDYLADLEDLTAETTGLFGTDQLNYELIKAPGTNAGIYSITVQLGDNPNYNVSTENGIYKINKIDYDMTGISFVDKQVGYNETEQSITLTFADGVSLPEGVEPHYTNNTLTELGTVHAKVSFTGDFDNYYYIEPMFAYLTVVPGTMESIVFVSREEKYDGNSHEIKVTGQPEDSIVTYSYNGASQTTPFEFTNAGTYQIFASVTKHGHNPVNMEATLEIKAKSVRIELKNATSVYGAEEAGLEYEVTGLINPEDLTIHAPTKEFGNDVGTYIITTTYENNPNYDVEVIEGEYLITKKSATITVSNGTSVYGSDDQPLTYTIDGIINEDILIVNTPTRTQNNNVGTYETTTTYEPHKNYEITVINGVYTVTPMEITVKADNKEITYKDAKPELTVTTSPELVLDDTLEGSLIVDSDHYNNETNPNVGEYQIVQGTINNPNYKIVNFTPGKLIINKRNIQITIEDTNQPGGSFNPTKTYGNVDPVLTSYYIDITGNLTSSEKENIINNISRESGEDVGSYKYLIDADIIPNYSASFVGYDGHPSLIITKRSITITPNENQSKIFGESDSPLKYAVVGSYAPGEESQIELTRDQNENVGSYAIKLDTIAIKHGSKDTTSNYDIIFVNNVMFTIHRKEVDMNHIVFDNLETTYDGTEKSISYSGNIPSEVTIDNSLNKYIDAGNHTAVIKFITDNNHIVVPLQKSASLIINKRAIEITAKPASKIYGELDPLELEYDITSENQLVSPSHLSGKLEREGDNQVGVYYIKQGTLTVNDNYYLTFNENTFVINKRPIKVAPKQDYTIIYGETEPQIEYHIVEGSLAYEDKFSGDITREPGLDARTYEITKGNLELNNNYDFTFVNGTFTITPRPITVAPKPNQFKYYGSSDPVELEYEITLGNKLDSDLFTGSLIRVSKDKEDIGTYEILQGTLSLGNNYDITFIEGVLFSITEIEITVIIENKQSRVGEPQVALSSRLQAGSILHDSDALDDVVSLSTPSLDANVEGEYQIIGENINTNYDVTFINEDGNENYGIYTVLPINKYTITFNTDGGTLVESQQVDQGSLAVTPTEPTKLGYDFVGWFSNIDLTQSFDFATPITNDITLYAKYNLSEITKVSISGYDEEVTFPDTVTLTANVLHPLSDQATYLWSNGATTKSININGAQSNVEYTVTVTITSDDGQIESKQSSTFVTIHKADYDTSGYQYETEYVYDGNPHSVVVTNMQPAVTASYSANNELTQYGSVEVTITFTTSDSNYNAPDPVIKTLSVSKTPINVDVVGEYTYDMTAQTIVLSVTGILPGDNITIDPITITDAGTHIVNIPYSDPDGKLINYNYPTQITVVMQQRNINDLTISVSSANQIIEENYTNNTVKSWAVTGKIIPRLEIKLGEVKLTAGAIDTLNIIYYDLDNLSSQLSLVDGYRSLDLSKGAGLFVVRSTIGSYNNPNFFGTYGFDSNNNKTANHYENYQGADVFVKLKSVTIGNTTEYKTIEDALIQNNGGTIIVKYYSKFATMKTRQRVYKNDADLQKLEQGHTSGKLVIPKSTSWATSFDASETIPTPYSPRTSDPFSKLTIPAGVLLNVSAEVLVDGTRTQTKGNQFVGVIIGNQYGVMQLDEGAQINLLSGANYLVYGFGSGGGIMNTFAGASITEMLSIMDYKGGRNTSYSYGSAIPFNYFAPTAIDHKLRLVQGVNYTGHGFVTARKGLFNSTSIRYFTTLKLATHDNNSSMLKITRGSVLKYIDDSGMLHFETENGAKLEISDNISVNIQALTGVTVQFAGKNIPFGSFYQFDVKDNSEVTFNSSIILFGGSNINIENGSKLILGDNKQILIDGGVEFINFRTDLVDGDANFIKNIINRPNVNFVRSKPSYISAGPTATISLSTTSKLGGKLINTDLINVINNMSTDQRTVKINFLNPIPPTSYMAGERTLEIEQRTYQLKDSNGNNY